MEEARLKKIRKIFGEHVRALRKAKGFSQERLGHESDLHFTYIGGVERGERNISLHSIAKIADALGITPSELLQGVR